ncbi:hypothetical protein HAX54_017109, partial [Datura stramonium]|nr:hypothetical protein [Datura stramonium]
VLLQPPLEHLPSPFLLDRVNYPLKRHHQIGQLAHTIEAKDQQHANSDTLRKLSDRIAQLKSSSNCDITTLRVDILVLQKDVDQLKSNALDFLLVDSDNAQTHTSWQSMKRMLLVKNPTKRLGSNPKEIR